jgi:hypothetical protein
MKKLTFKDLQEQGLVLTKQEAMDLQPHVSKISQHGSDGENAVDFGRSAQHTAEHYQQSTQANKVEQSTGFTPASGNQAPGPDTPVEQKKLVAGNFRGKPGEKLKAEGYQIGDMYPRLELKQDEPVFVDHEVTQEDLDENPQLVADGVKIGDVIQVPAEQE